MNRSSLLLVAVLAVGCLADAGCALGPTPATTTAGPVRDGRKDTCPDARLTGLPAGFALTDRELVPFSRTTLGVHATYRAASGPGQVETLSGGYVDDLTENYDDLHPVSTTMIAGTSTDVLEGTQLGSAVRLVVWRQPGTPPPCDVHAVIGTGTGAAQFEAALGSVVVNGRYVAGGSGGTVAPGSADGKESR